MIERQAQIKAQKNDPIDGVADIGKYKQTETSAFDRVMSQINIARHADFEKQLLEDWREAAEKKQLLSVLTCEIDFYNEYVDNYGMQGASFMLLVVALALKNICEQYGCFLARYKKEGFVVLIKGGDKNSVLAISDSLCKAVEESRTEHKYSKISKIVTLRVGIAAKYPGLMSILISNADNALQNAKILGHNKVSNDSKKRQQVVIETDLTVAAPVTEGKIEKQENVAPKPNIAAPDRNKIDLFAEAPSEKIKKEHNKPAAVRMYRGHAVDS